MTNWLGESFGCSVNNANSLTLGYSKTISSPYLDYATFARPRTFADMIDWSEYVYQLGGDLKDGVDKLFSYFATRLMLMDNNAEVAVADVAHVEKWSRLLNQTLLYGVHVMETGRNVAVYGNDFVTITLAQNRVMVCPRCSWAVRVNELRRMPEVGFRFENMKFIGRCQGRCRAEREDYRREFRVIQYAHRKPENLVIRHWPIRELEFDFLAARNKLRVFWKIPSRIKSLVLDKHDPDTLHDEDWAILQAICQDKMLEFDDEVLFHAKEPQLSGLENRGLGLPRTLTVARQQWLVQLLKKQCQSLAAAYVMPLEFFSLAQPNNAGFAGDPGIRSSMGEFSEHLDRMLAAHRRDPSRKFSVPYPVNYQVAGGTSNQFVPTELLKFATDELSMSLVPRQMLSGALTLETSPVFIRMFEATNRSIPALYNAFLWYFVRRVSELLGYEPVQAVHAPVSVEDNLGIDTLMQQAAVMGKASDRAWMSRFGMTPRWENAVMLAEQQLAFETQRQLQKIQEKYAVSDQAANQAAAGAGGGDPASQDPASQDPAAMQAATGNLLLPSQGFKPSQNVVEMQSQAEAMAATLLAMSPQQRKSELAVLHQREKSFHALVTASMREQRSDMSMAARQQAFPTA